MTPSRLLARQHNVTAAVSFEKPVLSPGSLAMCLAPIAALVYPLTLTAFNTAVTALETGHEPEIAAMIAAFALDRLAIR